MKRLCEYKDILGAPRTGVHRYRIFNIAVVDVLLTLILAFFIHKMTNWRLWKVIPITFLVGITFHWLFCVDTTVNMMIFGSF